MSGAGAGAAVGGSAPSTPSQDSSPWLESPPRTLGDTRRTTCPPPPQATRRGGKASRLPREGMRTCRGSQPPPSRPPPSRHCGGRQGMSWGGYTSPGVWHLPWTRSKAVAQRDVRLACKNKLRPRRAKAPRCSETLRSRLPAVPAPMPHPRQPRSAMTQGPSCHRSWGRGDLATGQARAKPGPSEQLWERGCLRGEQGERRQASPAQLHPGSPRVPSNCSSTKSPVWVGWAVSQAGRAQSGSACHMIQQQFFWGGRK